MIVQYVHVYQKQSANHLIADQNVRSPQTAHVTNLASTKNVSILARALVALMRSAVWSIIIQFAVVALGLQAIHLCNACVKVKSLFLEDN